MSRDPEQIRAEIDATRGELSADVNALAESVKPGNVARRQVSKARQAAVGVKERVMGTPHPTAGGHGFSDRLHSATAGAGDAASSAAGTVTDAASRAGSTVTDAASRAGSAVADSPQVVRARTQGNPLAAGLVAFGIGALIGSLLPSTEPEQRAAAKVKEAAEPLQQEVTDLAKESAENLRESAQEAVGAVRESAQEAVDTTRSEGATAAQQVKGDTQDAAGAVRSSRT